jgi:hypothetical protein
MAISICRSPAPPYRGRRSSTPITGSPASASPKESGVPALCPALRISDPRLSSYRAQTKGTVERPVRYVRGNFIYGRDFLGDADLDAQSLHWLDLTANARVHRTIGAVPRERFEVDERACLFPLASRSYRPLVLPVERTSRRTVLRPIVPAIASVRVEQRGLAAYQSLVEEVA